MTLAIDIGNTNITLGIFDDSKLVTTWRLQTNPDQTTKSYESQIDRLLKEDGFKASDLKDVVIGSVVPQLTSKMVDAVRQLFSCDPLLVSGDIKLPIQLSVNNPRGVGADIIANCVAARDQYPKSDVIIVDFGTVTTFDVVTKKDIYVGSVFVPSMRAMATTLSQSAALLPEITLTKPKKIIGTTSVDCMRSGVVFGYIELVEGILRRIKNEYKQAKIIVTGGYSSLISEELSAIDKINPNLTLEGMVLIFEHERGKI